MWLATAEEIFKPFWTWSFLTELICIRASTFFLTEIARFTIEGRKCAETIRTEENARKRDAR